MHEALLRIHFEETCIIHSMNVNGFEGANQRRSPGREDIRDSRGSEIARQFQKKWNTQKGIAFETQLVKAIYREEPTVVKFSYRRER